MESVFVAAIFTLIREHYTWKWKPLVSVFVFTLV